MSKPLFSYQNRMSYTLIIPVYNRPEETRELLESLTKQTFQDFEVLVIEDGSTVDSRSVAEFFRGQLNLRYYAKENTGPGPTRNYGAALSQADYLLFLDSDCLLPEEYMDTVDKSVLESQADAFGGPDRSHKDFTPIQKAISYAMTSFLTTGGIRGSSQKKLDNFYPRSFNMGIRRSVFNLLGGFSSMRFGEDVDLSIRIVENGYKSQLFPQAWVWHKRRTSLKKFFKQVFNSGCARIVLKQRHPGSLKIVHLLPALFTAGVLSLLVLSPFYPLALVPILLYALLLFLDALRVEKDLGVALLSVPSAFVQLTGYGTGFISTLWKSLFRKKDNPFSFLDSFYK